IGEALAAAIVEARQSRGGFTRVEELLQIPGLSAATYAAIADYLYIGA
ncbi:MAG: helix-hairpin-helix domain-containing protein, partial [Oscillospiraceae bacterium]|nr:helix-hairpin-helix domain-containing protein [Oscillospiraceae bacterium]